MAYTKIAIFCLLCAVVSCEPPVSGYNYHPRNTFNSFSGNNNYLPPRTDFNAPSNTYVPASTGHDYNHGHGHDNEEPKSYEFGYSVKDAESGNDYHRRESSDGHVVRGEYRVALPDGRTQIVTYHADWKTGFHADVRYEGEARYPEPVHNNHNGGYNYNTPNFGGSITGFHGNQGHQAFKPAPAYGPPGYH